jgi:hypothetical protein
MRIKLIPFLLLFAASVFPADTEMANYKSGISLTFSGTRGTDYQEEYFHWSKLMYPKKVVYIKDTTDITMAHNSLNSIASGAGYAVVGDDAGIIRYKVDQDVNWSGERWGDSGNLYPAYSAPFSFADLTYENGDPVVGTTGAKPSITQNHANKATFYYRGHLDTVGDEWHVICVGDDDSHLSSTGANDEFWASDAKEVLFVVNPKTPCITFTTNGVSGQFYTTPAKHYFFPEIFDQTTYLTGDDVSIRLDCLYGNNINLRINGGSWNEYAEPYTFDSGDLADGENTIEYWSVDVAYTKTRTIWKNPDYPSAGETHGLFMWGGLESEWQGYSNRLGGHLPETSDYYLDLWMTDASSDAGARDAIDSGWLSGRRTKHRRAGVRNAVIAKYLNNWTVKPSGKTISYAQYAKRALLDNIRTSDNVGHEQNHSGTALPCRDHVYRGYYDVEPIRDMLLTYDILIANYRSNQVSDGITTIEDYYVRDLLAGYVFDELIRDGAWSEVTLTTDTGGMWDTARKIVGSALITMCLKDYSTPYYGTSGYTDTVAVSNRPYPGQAITWKEVWIDNDLTLMGYPNLSKRLGIDEYNFDSDGHFLDKTSYCDMHLMGHCFSVGAYLFYLHEGIRFPNYELALMRMAQGTMMGTQGTGPVRYNVTMTWNKHFYEPAAVAIPIFKALSSSSSQSFSKRAFVAQEYFFYYTPTLEDPTPQVETPTISPNGGSFGSAQNVTLACSTDGAAIYYTTDGTTPTTSSTLYSAPFEVSSTLTVRAFAAKTDYTDSATASAAFVFSTAQVATPTFSPDGATDDETITVTISTATSGATIRYTTDGSEPTSGSTQYTAPLSVSSTTTIKARAFKSGEADSAVAQATFTLKADSPTFSPDGASSATDIAVGIATTTSGASIYYTTDGSTPTTSSTLYTGTFTVANSALVQAIAAKEGLDNSDVEGAFFNIGDFAVSEEWQNLSVSPVTGGFTLAFTVIPDTAKVNGLVSLSFGEADDFNDQAITVRFFNDGEVDVRNGAAYDADTTFAYTQGTSYRVEVVGSVATHTYSVIVTPDGGSPTTIATDYAFRSTQSSVATLNNLAFISVDVGNVFILSDIALRPHGTARRGAYRINGRVN